MNIDELHTQDIVNRSRKAILSIGLPPSSSVAGAVIWTAVLKNLGVNAEPVSVKVDILNPPLTEWFEKNGRLPATEVEMDETTKAGACIICLGSPPADKPYGAVNPATNAWSGHLVVVARPRGGEGTGYITDLSLQQAHRPTKGVNVTQPLVVPADATMLRKFTEGGQVRGKVNNSTLIYSSIHGDATYHASPDWSEQKTRYSILIEELTNSIKAYSRGVRDPRGYQEEKRQSG